MNGFKIKLDKVNEQCNGVFNEMDNIKNTYNLSEEDINDINEANKLLVVINDDYKKLTLKDLGASKCINLLQPMKCECGCGEYANFIIKDEKDYLHIENLNLCNASNITQGNLCNDALSSEPRSLLLFQG